MKIALVHTLLLNRGGAERQLLNLAIELQKLGNEVEIFTPIANRETCYPELMRQVTVNESYTKTSLNKLNIFSLYSMIKLGNSIHGDFDIINNHNAPTEWATFFAKRKLKIPVVWMCNEPPSWFYFTPGRGIRKKLSYALYELWDKTTVNYIDKIVVLSHVGEKLVKKIYGKPAEIVRSGIDIEKFRDISGKEIREQFGFEKNDFILLTTCNLTPIKMAYNSILALHLLSKQFDNVKLVFDGSGSREHLVALTKKLCLEDKVFFLNSKNDEELVKVYAACDVFVFPPKITWGLAAVEAMASSKPVIVSDACGVSEIITDNMNGFIFENSKPMQIVEKVALLMSDSKLRSNVGRAALNYVATNFSWKNYAKNMEYIFKKIISK